MRVKGVTDSKAVKGGGITSEDTNLTLIVVLTGVGIGAVLITLILYLVLTCHRKVSAHDDDDVMMTMASRHDDDGVMMTVSI